ncbi:sigma-70 family RNA polymerase sigma factor [Rhodospirillaceae bacterium KN72]|uniref:Sigma-70 family RNA polymerase sigma factor n=1 Tax=Pacificispira spongiicola TaxID=2729598 RepID=A0A7Y0HGM0_9PROT|nr:sigma-70 family RNA polymerase sigma factor [Pacificispira spongiicola]NMM44499.1 sigma-70 family RNA polymerase sigma factor [Pacificispira spongiicola]
MRPPISKPSVVVVQQGDGDLLEAATAGEPGAFRSLLDRYADRVFANCYRVLGNRTDAEDATQESFARLWKVLSPGAKAAAPDRDALGWLLRTSRNLCIDKLRRGKRWVADDDKIAMTADDAPNAEAQRQASDRQNRVRQVLSGLPDRQRVAIALVHFDGLPQADAADSLGISVDALESLLARGRRTLKQRLMSEREDLL